MTPLFHPSPCQLLFQISLPSSVAEYHNKASISFGWRIQLKMSPRLCVFIPSFPVCKFLYSSWVCDFQEKHITVPVLGCLPVAHFCHPRYRNWTSPTVGKNVSRNCVERIVSLVSRLKTEDWQDLASLLFHSYLYYSGARRIYQPAWFSRTFLTCPNAHRCQLLEPTLFLLVF